MKGRAQFRTRKTAQMERDDKIRTEVLHLTARFISPARIAAQLGVARKTVVAIVAADEVRKHAVQAAGKRAK